MSGTRTRLAALALMATLTAAFVSAQGVSAEPEHGRLSLLAPSLRAATAADQHVSCLVTLRTPSQALQEQVQVTGPVPADAVTLEQSWSPLGLAVRHRFVNLPVLAVSVPGHILPDLVDDPRVAGISPIRVARVTRKEGKGLMKVGDVQSRGFKGSGIGIAVLDTGVDYTHDELKPGGATATAKTVKLYDAIDDDHDPRDEHGHGTSVAGIAAGSDGGVAPLATVVAVRVLNREGEGTSEQILAGIDAVLESIRGGNPFNIKVANLSLGGYDDWPPRGGTCDNVDPAFTAAFQALTEAGVLVVVASGNGGCSLGVSWPACMSNALAVGAVYDDEICTVPAPWPIDCLSTELSFGEGQCMASGCSQDTKADRITCYSDSGDKLGVLAPSHCAKAPKKGGGYEDCFGGTSAAAPYASGVVALLAQAYPYLGPAALRKALEGTGNPRTDARNGVTRNRVDARAAYDYLATYCVVPGLPQGVAPSADFVCRTGSYTLSWGAGGSADTYRVERSSSSLFTTPEVFTTTDTSQPMTVTGAKAVTLYHRVRAERSCGSYSPWSAVATVSFQPECAYQPRRHLRR